MKEFFGYGRERDKSGAVVKRFLNTYVNCLHTQVGHARENMEVLIAEFDMSEIKYVGQMSSSQNSRVIDPSGISYAVTNGHKDGEPKIIEPIGCSMRGRNPENPSERGRSNGKYKQRIEMGSNISNTITSVQKDALVAEPLCIPQATKQGYIEVAPGSVFDASYPDSKTRRGRVQEGGQVSPTLMAGGEAPCRYEGKEDNSYRIRKLTPRECFRLMGVSETNIDNIQQSGVSQSQQYKMAGNSIVVDVLYHIFRKMFTEPECESQQLYLF